MLRTTLTITALAFLALAAHAEPSFNRGHPEVNHRSQRPIQLRSSLDSLKFFNATDEHRVYIEGGNEKPLRRENRSHLAVVTIAYGNTFINCSDNEVDFPVLHINNQVTRATADFNTSELDNCSSVIPSESDIHIHIECNFNGARYFDGVLNYTEEELGDETNGQIKITQASATCTLQVSTDSFTDDFPPLEGGEITRAHEK